MSEGTVSLAPQTTIEVTGGGLAVGQLLSIGGYQGRYRVISVEGATATLVAESFAPELSASRLGLRPLTNTPWYRRYARN